MTVGHCPQRFPRQCGRYSLLTNRLKGDAAYLLRSPKPLPADVKLAVCELAQTRAQIFGVPKGTLYAHEISFAKSCTIKPLKVTKVDLKMRYSPFFASFLGVPTKLWQPLVG